MGNEEYSGPSISFPLGLALLIITILISISAFFSCFYNWNRLRGFSDQLSSMPGSHSYPSSTPLNSDSTRKKPDDLEQKAGESLTVVMPGDEIPKFLAFPAPPTWGTSI